MGIEIERKFLVDANAVMEMLSKSHYFSYFIRQGYIMEDVEAKKVTRVRATQKFDEHGTRFDQAFITIKQGSERAIARTEYEYEIPYRDGDIMLNRMCNRQVLRKKRTVIPYMGELTNITAMEFSEMKWELDTFIDPEFNGLMLVEMELPRLNVDLTLPSWITEEVTEDPQYINSNLIKLINT